ncbi:hypothetical protein TUBRATIS_12790 [Tubulinosema ratisbonensis]|uniref:Uncharacterized protein n=1 Tax=Tubulinosema ratisbonensis TaxID=291195 RepID=A0A437ALZ8_9MICR|nr:hypothetical protein TUBRATIS_12790 [Tubulinosema ratisbonensis]
MNFILITLGITAVVVYILGNTMNKYFSRVEEELTHKKGYVRNQSETNSQSQVGKVKYFNSLKNTYKHSLASKHSKEYLNMGFKFSINYSSISYVDTNSYEKLFGLVPKDMEIILFNFTDENFFTTDFKLIDYMRKNNGIKNKRWTNFTYQNIGSSIVKYGVSTFNRGKIIHIPLLVPKTEGCKKELKRRYAILSGYINNILKKFKGSPTKKKTFIFNINQFEKDFVDDTEEMSLALKKLSSAAKSIVTGAMCDYLGTDVFILNSKIEKTPYLKFGNK